LQESSLISAKGYVDSLRKKGGNKSMVLHHGFKYFLIEVTALSPDGDWWTGENGYHSLAKNACTT
jgi:hypothetical protein